MLKSIYILLTCFCFSFTSFAQFNFGIKGGLNYATFETNYDKVGGNTTIGPNFHFLPGYHIGAFSEYHFHQKLSLKAELLNGIKGAKFHENGAQEQLHLYYLMLPVHFQFEPITNFQLQLGVEPAYLVSESPRKEEYAHLVQTSFDLGISAGLSIRFSQRFGINLRLVFGMRNLAEVIYAEPWESVVEVVWHRNRSLHLGVEYLLKKNY